VIERKRTGDVCVCTLDRPTRRNALTRSGLEALRTVVTRADASVVAVRGAGPAFRAGADLGAADGDAVGERRDG